uniref:CUE domain-containing protein n=1 Tax=Eutreptiella gymnastica TaxID=73025 RepID=A0A6T2BPM8_9EUGL
MASQLYAMFPDETTQYVDAVLKRNGEDVPKAADDLLSGASSEAARKRSNKKAKKGDAKVQQLMDKDFKPEPAEAPFQVAKHTPMQAVKSLLSGFEAGGDSSRVDDDGIAVVDRNNAGTGPPVKPPTRSAKQKQKQKSKAVAAPLSSSSARLLSAPDTIAECMDVDNNEAADVESGAAAAAGPPIKPTTHTAKQKQKPKLKWKQKQKLKAVAQSQTSPSSSPNFLHWMPPGLLSFSGQMFSAMPPMGIVYGAAWGALPQHVPPRAPRPRAVELLDDGALMRIVERAEGAVREMELQIAEQKAEPPAISAEDQQQLVALYDDMIERFDVREYQQKHGMQPYESTVCALEAGQLVPVYFANVQYNSIFYRKALSMAGLRNLILCGREIFAELKAQLFASDPSKYTGAGGLNRMKRMTGNMVDLDTVVLRCNDPTTLETINKMNKAKGNRVYANVQEFAHSRQAAEMAVAAALPLLEGFVKEFGLTKAQQKTRRVQTSQVDAGKIPVAHDNSSRGKWPLWQYINAGVNTMHVNVPNMADIIGALLRAPFAALRAYLRCKDLPEELARFYEDGISDSCFNGKWKALEEFNAGLDKQGSITQILADLQAKHQSVFTAQFFDADDRKHTKEIREMVRLAKGVCARDRSGATRPITKADVRAWVNDPAVEI